MSSSGGACIGHLGCNVGISIGREETETGVEKETIVLGNNNTVSSDKVISDYGVSCESQVYTSLMMALFFPILTVFVFYLDPD